MKKTAGLKVNVPSTISMLAYGIPDISIALDMPSNEIVANIGDDSGFNIEVFTNKANDKENTRQKLELLIEEFAKSFDSNLGVNLKITNKILFGRGLGNLEASLVGSFMVISKILKVNYDKYQLFDLIADTAKKTEISINLSRIAAILFGGIILYNPTLNKPIQKLYAPSGLKITLIDTDIKTDEKLFENVDAKMLFEQSRNNASFVKALFESDHDLLSNSLKNNVFEGELSKNIAWFKDIKDIVYSQGAYAIGFSNKGEISFILNPNTLIQSEINNKINAYFESEKIELKLINTEFNLNGVGVV